MTREDVARNIKIGIFTALALAIFGVALMVLGKKSGFFQTSYRLEAQFSQVQGLKVGQPVWLNGLEVGLVERIRLEDPSSQGIEVVMAVDRGYKRWIRADSVAFLETKGLLGDKIVNISMGSESAEPLADGATITTSPPVDLGSVMADAGRIISGVDQLVKAVNGLTEDLSAGRGTLGKLISDDQLYTETRATVTELKGLVQGLRKGEGTLGRLVRDEGLYDRIDKLVAQVESGEGNLGKLIYEEDLYADLASATSSLATILATVETAEGSAGKALMEPGLHDDLQELVRSLKALSADIQENPKKYLDVSVF